MKVVVILVLFLHKFESQRIKFNIHACTDDYCSVSLMLSESKHIN